MSTEEKIILEQIGTQLRALLESTCTLEPLNTRWSFSDGCETDLGTVCLRAILSAGLRVATPDNTHVWVLAPKEESSGG